MPETTEKVLAEVAAERARQDEQWGGSAHDDEHGTEDWRQYREKFEDRIYADLWDRPGNVRGSLVKIAALAVAQIEALDRARATDEADAR